MPSKIEEAGYQLIRDWVASVDGWDYVELRDEAGGAAAETRAYQQRRRVKRFCGL